MFFQVNLYQSTPYGTKPVPFPSLYPSGAKFFTNRFLSLKFLKMFGYGLEFKNFVRFKGFGDLGGSYLMVENGGI